ncbi:MULTISPECIES: metal ABC transporter solute-binding protein, Zn/Mn family [unclassified Actinotalea]|uniref:metal ABC transporter solute-binding protein, Zn/Mn family n=1 Tax=unclassified Actinotalea TaxID=2638618 RepID=UPI0015F59864|nr:MULTISPECIES: zinc ABC transporter substrate-binding protein [unclassified Actinotalea]
MPNFGGAAALGACLAAVLAGCAPPAEASGTAGDDRPVVLATFTVLADMAGVVAGPDARVESLTGVGTEIHGYEPSPDDLRRAAGADLLLANGLGLEVWLEDLVAPLDLPTVVLTEAVDPLPIAGSDHANPHAWMSPRTGADYAVAIADALGDLAPADAAAFDARAQAYAAELLELHDELTVRLAALPPDQRLLVTCEGAFSYLARDAGLDEAYLWPVNAERQGTPRQVADVVRRVRDAEVPAVFCESTVSSTAQEQVARETGARFGGTLYVDSLSGPDGPVPTYLDLLRHDVDVVVAGLTGAPAGEGDR